MSELILDCESIHTKEELHDALASLLSFPDCYGRNLDAAYDCLTEPREDLTLILRNPDLLSERLGRYGDAFLRMLQRASQDNDHLTVNCDE